MGLLIEILILHLTLLIIGIYIKFCKDPLAKKNFWKTGMVVGIIFITISVIIPFKVVITQYDLIPLPAWSGAMMVNFLIALLLEGFLGGPGSLGPFDTLYIRFSIALLLLYGGLGAFIGYIISIFIPLEKNNNMIDSR